jgi:hypothetical protein
MAIVHYRSLADAEIVDVEFVPLRGRSRSLKLLVDSGFTGTSSLILGNDSRDLIHAVMLPAQATGALRGAQDRAWVACRIRALAFEKKLIAIITNITQLSLPPRVNGMAGLGFLRQFALWGSERTARRWRFFLSDGKGRRTA